MEIPSSSEKIKIQENNIQNEDQKAQIIPKIIAEPFTTQLSENEKLEKENDEKLEKLLEKAKPIQKLLPKVDPKILNRRFIKLQEMIEKDDDYFSEESIRSRDPLLYHLYIGRYQRNGDIHGNMNPNLSDVLFQAIDTQQQEEELQKAAKLYKEISGGKEYFTEKQFNNNRVLSAEEIADNEDELIRIMHYRFLMGEDKGLFNYEEIDKNDTLDNNKFLEQDSEDAYFDKEDKIEEEPKKKEKMSKYTGELDY